MLTAAPPKQNQTPSQSKRRKEIFFQPKLTINQPNDIYEQEADAMAEKVTRVSNENAFQQSLSKPSLTTIQQKQITGSEKIPDASTENYIGSLNNNGRSLTNKEKSFFEPRFGYDFSNVKIHTDSEAAKSTQSINALAYTTGNNIVFNEGQYNPSTASGKKLLGHELTHVIQQKNISAIQRQPVQMPPLTVSTGMPSDLSSLSTPATAGSMTVAADPALIGLNSQLPLTVLPFTPGGWNGNEIANKLGQYDRIPGTDSDAVRCVQSVALMSHILMGPSAAISYLTAIALQGMLTSQPGKRQQTALRVIDYVKNQINNQRATYGDMYWAMESVHDLFYADQAGTPAQTANTVREQITPAFDLSHNMTNMDKWCSNSNELLSQAATLHPGDQLMLNSWSVSFNSVFDDAGVPPTRQQLTYTQTNEQNQPLRTVSIRRIDTSQGKPAPGQIDTNRDNKHGHQMLIFKDPADSHIKLYEPELTTSGKHLFDLTADASVINSMLFFDQPRFELFEYVQLWGKMSPSTLVSPVIP